MAAEPALLKLLMREKTISVLTTSALIEYLLLEHPDEGGVFLLAAWSAGAGAGRQGVNICNCHRRSTRFG